MIIATTARENNPNVEENLTQILAFFGISTNSLLLQFIIFCLADYCQNIYAFKIMYKFRFVAEIDSVLCFGIICFYM